jgi:hypothetical protein
MRPDDIRRLDGGAAAGKEQWRVASGEWSVESGGVESGGVACGEWRVASGEWRVGLVWAARGLLVRLCFLPVAHEATGSLHGAVV